ncbi:DUF421 domain-containing protein [Tsuneonella deserti]|uniref:DUF421 domain-containing protein n=2 Tax=Tsuneonella TaxID=2800686 RepID=A0A6I4TED0_9SPHN|nr:MULTISPECIES: YetF domain-containing protein [Tsuneonella]MXO75017.1 DUF421 domain-containing protein [Tsuneonella aeria]GGD91447.1 DUF421 domain-containing protein [Tsuneonella deserti]
MLFDGFHSLLRITLGAITAYAALIIFLRISGKRSLAKLNAFDFVITVALGSTLASFILSKDVSFADGLLALAILLGLQYAISRASIASDKFGRLVRSQPRLLLKDGLFDEGALQEERVTLAEGMAAIRKHGIGNPTDVAAVILETDGSLSVIAAVQSDQLTSLEDVKGFEPSGGRR